MATRLLVDVKCASEGAHRSRLAPLWVPGSSAFGPRRELELRLATRAKGHDGHCVHSELAHGLAQSSNSNQRPVTRSYFASRLGMMLNNTRSPWGPQALKPRLLSENQKRPRPRVTNSVVTFESGCIPCGPRLLGSQDWPLLAQH